jgi:hypothetical protein
LISRTNTYPIYKNEKQREAETITEVSAQPATYTTTSYKTGPSDIKSATFTHLRNRPETLQFF